MSANKSSSDAFIFGPREDDSENDSEFDDERLGNLNFYSTSTKTSNAVPSESDKTSTINFISNSNGNSNFIYSRKQIRSAPASISSHSYLRSPPDLSQVKTTMSIPSSNTSNVHSYNNSNWNKLNLSLFLAYTFSTAATTVPITIVPAIFESLLQDDTNYDDGAKDSQYQQFYASNNLQTTVLSSRVATYAILGCALGKFLNGHLSDVFGARKIAMYYSLLMALSLLGLSCAQRARGVFWYCAFVEFFQSVQWPCCVNILAAHYHYEGETGLGKDLEEKNQSHESHDFKKDINDINKARYTGGVYVTSLASRFGALIAMPFCSLLIQHTHSTWRSVARIGAAIACLNSLIYYLFIMDSPSQLHCPMNPLKSWNMNTSQRTKQKQNFNQHYRFHVHPPYLISSTMSIFKSMVYETLYPSMRQVLSNGTFWIVSIAHTGGSMIRSSERILATYYQDTSHNYKDLNDGYSLTASMNADKSTGGLAVFLSFGLLFGVISLGNIFTNASNDEQRKKLVMMLYAGTVCMCYSLSFLSIPSVQNLIQSPTFLRIMQLIVTFCMGACIAVPYYHIPPIVAAQFGKEKGMYSSYTEGVAFLLSSMVWKQVGDAVERGNPTGNGWAYGWAFIALLVIFSGVVMVEFMDHYFCRRGDWNRIVNADTVSPGFGLRFPLAGIGRNRADSYSENQNLDYGGERKSLIKGDLLQRRGSRTNKSKLNFPVSLTLEKPKFLLSSQLSTVSDNECEEHLPLYPSEEILIFQESKDDKYSNQVSFPPTLQERLQHLLAKDENQICADCPNKLPRWASILVPHQDNHGAMDISTAMGCFICQECAGAHRNLGVHICFVRSVDHDEWKECEVRSMERGGNSRINLLYEYLLVRKKGEVGKPTFKSNRRDRERFIINKYKKKQYYVDSLDALSKIDDSNLISSFSDDSSYDDESSDPNSLIELVHSYSPQKKKRWL